MFRILFFGDIVGRPGRQVMKRHVARLKAESKADLVIANGENSAGGLGIEPGTAEEIFGSGVDIITTGNHVWNKRELAPYLEKNSHRILRPLNFPAGAPGTGSLVYTHPSGVGVLIVNAQARVFMSEFVDCPFHALDHLLAGGCPGRRVVFVDFHGEATSEKIALGWHLDGRVSALVGTHTHVQTSDARVLPGGLAYISDVGMCGPRDGVIGMSREPVIEKFRTQRPTRFEVAGGATMINAVVIDVDPESGKASRIVSIREEFEEAL